MMSSYFGVISGHSRAGNNYFCGQKPLTTCVIHLSSLLSLSASTTYPRAQHDLNFRAKLANCHG